GLLDHKLAEEVERLGPFGIGNPGGRLLVPAARFRDVRPRGEGQHARFSLQSGANSAAGVAFGVNGALSSLNGEPTDVAVRLELDEGNGAVSPRACVRGVYPLSAESGGGANGRAGDAAPGCGGCAAPAKAEEWWRRLHAER